MGKESKLTPKQELFIREYLKDLNAKQAAIRAGYSEKAAEVNGPRLLRNAQVAAAVAKASEKVIQKLDLSVDRVLNEIARMAFVDPRKFFNPDGSIKPVVELDDDTAAALQGFDVEKLFQQFGKGKAQEVGTVSKIKIADKSKSLEMLAKYHKLLTEKIEHTGTLQTLSDEQLAQRLSVLRSA